MKKNLLYMKRISLSFPILTIFLMMTILSWGQTTTVTLTVGDSPGYWYVPSGVTQITVKSWGPGGGSGGIGKSWANGGGHGGYTEFGSIESYGGNGSQSVLSGVILTSDGGNGGTAMGDINFPGENGGNGSINGSAQGGSGGSSPFGGATQPGAVTSSNGFVSGNNGNAPGGGASGSAYKSDTESMAVGGGGGGGYAEKTITGLEDGDFFFYIVGEGGSAGLGELYNGSRGADGKIEITYTVDVCNPPTITGHPSTATQSLCLNDVATSISVTATGDGLTYQWYSNATASNSGGTLLGGETNNTFTPPASTTVTLYYYCVVTGTCGTATSDVSGAVTVHPLPDPLVLTGSEVCEDQTTSIKSTTSDTEVDYALYTSGHGLVGSPVTGTGSELEWTGMPAGTGYYVVGVHNTTNCSSTSNAVDVVVSLQPEISCPSSVTVNNVPGTCGASVTFEATASQGTEPITFAYYLNYGEAEQTEITSPQTFPVGTTWVTAVATNDCGTEDCSFYVTVNDTEYPAITCPANITQSKDPIESGTDVEFVATATDNCSYEISYYLNYGEVDQTEISSPHPFPVGTTSVTAVATDPAGNEDVCTFDVAVTDDEDPTAVCKNYETYLGMDGSVTITPGDVDDGSSDDGNFVLSVDPDVFDCDDMEGSEEKVFYVTLTVTDDSENTDECIAEVTVKQRPTALIYNGDLSGQYSDEVNLSATLTDDLSGDPIEGMTVTFEIGTQSTTGITNLNGVATATLVLTQNPCDSETWVVKATFDGECPFWGSSDEDTFDYQPEEADMEYTGTDISATESMQSDDFTVTLRAAITDDDDGDPGDIGNAMARFVVDGDAVCDYMPVIWFSEGDKTIGMIEYDWSDALTDNPTTFDVQIELDDCYYTGMSIAYPLTVYNAVGDFITGGGHMIMTEVAAGFYAPTPGSKLNFGFNVKFNKNGKNLQGKMNIIYRMFDGDELTAVYQIKSNATTSLGTNMINPDELIAEFVSKANLTDVTDPEYPVEISGNLTLHVTMIDKGDPGDEDMIAFTLYDDSSNALWFSSNWDETKTIEQLINGGNLVVHSGAAITEPDPDDEDDEGDVTPVPKGKNKSAKVVDVMVELNHLVVYPNPFSERVRFEFVPAEAVQTRIDILDVTGRLVKTVFNQPVQAGVAYNAEFKSEGAVHSLYIYRMTMGGYIQTGKVIYRK